MTIVGFLAAMSLSPAAIATDGPVPVAAPPTAFPLRLPESGPFLHDAAGRPFLIHGDTAWSLIVQLDRVDAVKYLEDRRARGFNTILVNLIDQRFGSRTPANIAGDLPFVGAQDFRVPNEKYFEHADFVLSKARELGFLVLLTPAYAGYFDGAEGWYQQMVDAGPEALHEYGRFLGRRYGSLDNILWLNSGDYDPPDRSLVRALASGIRLTAPDALQSVHGHSETRVEQFWKGEDWLDVDTLYTYGSVLRAARARRESGPPRPFFLLESAYENEHGAAGHRVRRQAYEAVLSGAAGQVYGNNPIWHFDGPGLFPVAGHWTEHLASPGAQSMTVLWNVMQSIPWWTLRPAAGLVTTSSRGDEDGPIAAATTDGAAALVYIPTGTTVDLDTGRLAGGGISADWIDPSDGSVTPITVGTPADWIRLTPPGRNAAGDPDWVLRVEAGPTSAATR
jgi:hypothetical protein